MWKVVVVVGWMWGGFFMFLCVVGELEDVVVLRVDVIVLVMDIGLWLVF